MPIGKVSNWNFPRAGKRNSEGFGFVRVDDDRGADNGDLFLYADDIKDPKLRSQAKLFGLKNGTRIDFDIKEPVSSRKSRLAVNVMPIKDDDGGGRSSRRASGRSRSRSGGREERRRRSPTPRRARSGSSGGRSRSPARRSRSAPRQSRRERSYSGDRGRRRSESR
mmetsp:Transcript_54597/g.130258  ORF Transcript_54597/g.130258 Transcript_54597/m.130258 type:complete len:166 (-) Transcript_54597:33-530(-)